jgi:hypothetical protein
MNTSMLQRITILSLLFIASLPSSAQFRNIKLDTSTPDNPYVCEPSVAVNPKNPDNIVAASVLDNIYVTKDGGTTWTKVKVKSPFGVYGDPSVIADSKGRFYFFHLSDPTMGKGDYSSEKLDRIVVQESSDGGLTWSEGAGIGFNPPKDQDKQWPTIDAKGNIYLTWTQFDVYGSNDPACQSNILFSKSRNGKSWSDPVQITQTPGDCLDGDNTAEGAVPVVALGGKIFVVWANQNKIFFDRSYDGGQTWLSNDLGIAEQKGGWDLKIPGHDRCNGMPILMADNTQLMTKGMLYLVWADQTNGDNDTDIWFTRSSNGGDSWTPPIRVNDDGPGKHQYLPWLAVDQVSGYVYIVYYDRRNHEGSATDVYLAWSKDTGTTFTNVKISESPFTPDESAFFGDYNNISAHNGVVVPIWTRMDSTVTSVMTTVIKADDLTKK